MIIRVRKSTLFLWYFRYILTPLAVVGVFTTVDWMFT